VAEVERARVLIGDVDEQRPHTPIASEAASVRSIASRSSTAPKPSPATERSTASLANSTTGIG
jgi:hypothetical protein